MLIAAARSAEQLVPAIDAVTAQIAAVTVAINSSWIISGGDLVIQNPDTGWMTTNVIAGLTLTESQTVFNSMLTILNNRLTTYNSQLASL